MEIRISAWIYPPHIFAWKGYDSKRHISTKSQYLPIAEEGKCKCSLRLVDSLCELCNSDIFLNISVNLWHTSLCELVNLCYESLCELFNIVIDIFLWYMIR